MRLPESKAKDAILHLDQAARQAAVRYFSELFSRATSLMPQAIRAIEAYGRRDGAIRYIRDIVDRAQTEETVAWVIGELNSAIDHVSRARSREV